jgi:hypothetical protein
MVRPIIGHIWLKMRLKVSTSISNHYLLIVQTLCPPLHLWQWFREDLTYHTCYQNQVELIQQVELFQQRLNQTPLDVADRLWVASHLEPKEEKLRVSS